MSSYRSSYTPWKSNFATSYKSGASSAYSSRDDISTTRYSSLAPPSTYRPSFSGGTYRIKRDPPATSSYTSRYSTSAAGARPDKENVTDAASKASQLKRYTTTTSHLGKYGTSREPSPAAVELTNRIRSREPSPVARTLRGKSRDPSPVADTNCKIGYGGVNSYRMSTPRTTATTTAGYNARYGSSAVSARTSTASAPADKSISYLSVSDFRARSISRAKESAARKSSEKELEDNADSTEKDNVEQDAAQAREESGDESEAKETFVAVSVVTRATSPTPPGSTTVQRTRRIDIAKTIEKTIQRSTRRKKMLEKEIQSDRLDDSTRYSRFGLSSRVPSYSPHSESRYTASNLRYSASPLSTTSKSSHQSSSSSTSESKKEGTSTTSGGKSSRAPASKSKLSPPKVVRINSRPSSVENLSIANTHKPPAAPKAESPTKSTSSSSHTALKLPNKDFRKSALNVGPTDRPRKSRTPSSGTDSDAVPQSANETANGASAHPTHRKERSPSAGSEVSNASGNSIRRAGSETRLRPRCHAKAASSLSRHNSNSNLRNSSHKSCTPATTTTSSSSGTDSSSERRKASKKNVKKKTPNSHNKDAASNNKISVTKCAASTGDADDLLSPKRLPEDENNAAPQPPAIAAANQPPAEMAAESPCTYSKSPSKSPFSPQEKSAHRLQKLSSVSNFFAARQNDTNSEPIFLESSENSPDSETIPLISSLTGDCNTNTSPTNNATTATTTLDPASTAESTSTTSKRNFNTNLESSEDISAANRTGSLCTQTAATVTATDLGSTESHSRSITKSSSSIFPHDTTIATETASQSRVPSEERTATTTTTTTTASTEEPDESSWWQDTSRQINTASALDFNQKDDMRFKLRHIDSGETAWWLRNDEDDTLADDNLNTLNQEEEDASEATDQVQSLSNDSNTHSGSKIPQAKYTWWTNELNDEETHNENDQNETNYNRSRSTDQKANGRSSGSGGRESRQLPRSHCTPEKQWWGESNGHSDSRGSKGEKSSSSNKQNGSIQLKICRVESGERPWWLDEEDAKNSATVEATVKLPPRKSDTVERSLSSGKNASDDKHWWMSGPTKMQFNVQRVESGERAWWQQDDEEAHKPTESQQTQPSKANIRHCDSGEKAWWLQGDEQSKSDTQPMQNGHARSKVQESNGDDDGNASEDEATANHDAEVHQIINRSDQQRHFANCSDFNAELSNSFNFEYSERPPPLGQCASPVGLEEPHSGHSKSPYENIPMSKVQVNQQQQQQQHHHLQQSPPTYQYQQPYQQQQQQQQEYYNNGNANRPAYYPPQRRSNYNNNKQSSEKLFISRHHNIDELLGGSCRPLSPLFLDGSSFSTLPSSRNIFVEEITPDQVRIHDSTAQMPVIQRMERDEWDNYASTAAANTASRFEQRTIDDAAIQVYKDGDYGAYLDLESSLAEQAEEIEGLSSNRKNSLVVRTQLSVRVHAIIEKLLSSEGSDLRRALFSLKQVFQEDKDLVHAFVALGGLNCLVRVGNGADQNYQNYILRALGQVMLYVDGMNGVMKHEPTMQWLYSLIASNYRSVVKTALKLLLVFVEYAETNCYALVNAIHAVDKAQGTLPWSNIMRLLKDYDNADAELVIYATSLINKTLAGLNDQDSFYDESDLLEQQGMESVIQRYMSKQGTDLDLLDQLQLYEAVLKFEDGESDGIRLPDNSLRKTQRHRPGTDTAERRKSRRHSTGTSPTVNTRVIPSPKRMTPAHGVLDEDSSGSTNSVEYISGVFNERKPREGVGVTPGLRRRRERAERHKSFLKEQQEAVANGIFACLEKREEIGQIVTAIPATVKNGDSPPESLILTNESIANINDININSNNHSSNSNNSNSNHTLNISYPNITANATNPNINSNNQNQNNNNNTTNNNVTSPTRHLLGSSTISIINNSLDKTHNNNNNNNNNHSNSNNNRLQGTPEFLTKKSLLMERNATVINGIMKNIHRGSEPENHANNNNAYKKFESDANRLNSYYSQLNTPKNQNQQNQHQHQPQQQQPHQHASANTTPGPTIQIALAAVLSPKKALNGFDFTQATPTTANTSEPQTPQTPQGATCDSVYDSTPSNLSPLTPTTSSHPSATPDANSPLSPPPYTPCNSTAAPPPPPPPPPPPDLMGFNIAIHHATPFVPPVANTDSENVACNSANADALLVAESDNEDKKLLQQLKRDHTVKDLTQRLSNMPTSPTHEEKLQNRIVGDMSGLISKAKEGLAKSKSKGEMSRSSSVDQEIKKPEPKKSENELHWEELVRSMSRPLNLCDLDFTDLNSEDEKDVLAPRGLCGGVPPPPPPFGGVPPPLMPSHIVCPPPMNNMSGLVPPPLFSYSNYGHASLTNSANSSMNGSMNGDVGNTNTIKKNKKTVKLFWKEVREDMIPVVVGKTIWDELPSANVDTQKLEHLFESRAKDLMTKKQQEMNKSKEVIVLDHKRSNAINIAMTKLPPPRAIKAAILKMDATVVTREGIDKLLNMLPTDEERGKIQEAQMANPELPLGSAEQFLLTLASISELAARLKLWAFRLDFDNSEKEIAEPLMDLKQGIEILRHNRTFKCILSTLLSVGIFLNGAPVKGFQIEYLAKVPEVKDTVHKHSLLHHLCHMVMESNPDTTDLYSEIGPITRASKADFADLAHNLNQLESECKASWDRLKLIAKHDCPPQLKQKLVDFLADCAERIIILQIVHRRVINRYRKFLLWLGAPQHSVAESKPNEFCRVLSEFALEYRTTRERVQQQLEKKANHRERNKTRGKLIIDMAKFKTKEDRADAELKVLLGTPSSDTADGTLTWRRRRAENLRSPIARQSEENFTDGDDEILESLVKTATKAPGTRTTPRERKRTRHADRKSLRRTLKNGLTEEEKQHVAALIKTY